MTVGLTCLKSSMIRIDAPIMPVAWTRPQFDSRTKKVYNTRRYEQFKDELGYYARLAMKGHAPFTGEIKLHADFYRPKPKPRKGKPEQVSFVGDVDNYLKAVMDALSKIVYLDDRQVVQISGAKIFGASHIEIELEELS